SHDRKVHGTGNLSVRPNRYITNHPYLEKNKTRVPAHPFHITSVPEMTNTRENHRHVALVRGGNHFLVAKRTAGLNGAGCSGIGSGNEPVGKWKKSITRDRATLEREPCFLRFPNRDPRSIDTRHLPGTASECAVDRSIDDCVR